MPVELLSRTDVNAIDSAMVPSYPKRRDRHPARASRAVLMMIQMSSRSNKEAAGEGGLREDGQQNLKT
jgi:hypothetical protein